MSVDRADRSREGGRMQARSHRTSKLPQGHERNCAGFPYKSRDLTESIDSELRLSELSVLTDKVGCGIQGERKKCERPGISGSGLRYYPVDNSEIQTIAMRAACRIRSLDPEY